MKVKICGLQETHHVEAAVKAGADFIGFVFAPSKRRVSLEQAKKLSALVPENILRVGVFVNPTQQDIDKAVEAASLDIIQLHGDETPEFCREQVKPVMKAFSIQSQSDVEQLSRYDVRYHLVDAPGTTYRGGSGHAFDWGLIPTTDRPKYMMLAGGLSPENILKAADEVGPFGVDVSSGVETDGVKDKDKIKEFIQLAKSIEE